MNPKVAALLMIIRNSNGVRERIYNNGHVYKTEMFRAPFGIIKYAYASYVCVCHLSMLMLLKYAYAS